MFYCFLFWMFKSIYSELIMGRASHFCTKNILLSLGLGIFFAVISYIINTKYSRVKVEGINKHSD